MRDSPSPDAVPPVQPDPLDHLGNDQLVPILVESFSGMFDLLRNYQNIYGNGKINWKLLVHSMLKLLISLSVLAAILLLSIAVNYLFNPRLVGSFISNLNITATIQTLIPLLALA